MRRFVGKGPEVVAELHSRQDEERINYALAALRLGVLAMRTAGGQVDTAAIKHVSESMLQGIHEAMNTHHHQLANTFVQYFDPTTGVLSQRLQNLLQKDGELERILDEKLGDNSTLARTLVAHSRRE